MCLRLRTYLNLFIKISYIFQKNTLAKSIFELFSLSFVILQLIWCFLINIQIILIVSLFLQSILKFYSINPEFQSILDCETTSIFVVFNENKTLRRFLLCQNIVRFFVYIVKYFFDKIIIFYEKIGFVLQQVEIFAYIINLKHHSVIYLKIFET